MTRTAALTPLALAALLLLTGCAGGATPAAGTTAPALEAAPATGETITGDGYSYQVPDGWGDPGAVPGYAPDSIAADLSDADGFADNVNVVKSPGGEITAEQVETLGVGELEGAGATEVEVEDRVTVAGGESAHLSALLSAEGVVYRIDQYYVTEDGQTYVVTFSFSDTVDADARDEVAGSVLATWAWS